jgi:hypothetical protein
MVPNGPIGKILKLIFYPTEVAVYAPLYCLLSRDARGGSFMTNFHNFWRDSMIGALIFRVLITLRLRELLLSLAIPWVIAFQSSSYGIHAATPDYALQDNTLSQELYRWSKQAVQPYVDEVSSAK